MQEGFREQGLTYVLVWGLFYQLLFGDFFIIILMGWCSFVSFLGFYELIGFVKRGKAVFAFFVDY